nr:hypothetical protein HK105_002094 [Polyrhizophydium stewartii]
MQLHFAAARTRTCLFAGTLASAEQSIRDFDALLAEAGVGLSEVDPLHQQPEAAAADADARTSAVLPEFAEPLLLRHMASVLLHLRTGNNKHALSLLAPIHSIIEAHSQQLSNQLVLLAYLFSGLVHKPDETFKAKMFLVEGLKLASESGDLASRLDVARTRVAMLSSLGHVCLSRAEFLEAFDAVKTGTQLCLEHDDLLQEFEQQLKLDWAMVLQALGRFDDATDDAGAETELEWFAAFHRSLILHCASGADEHQVQIEHVPDVPENASLRLKSFGSFVHGCLEARAGNTKQAKQRILEAFKTAEVTTSAHMRVVCLGALSGLFVLSDPAQADKMATTAFVLARRSHSDLLLSCCSRLLAEHAQQRGDAAKAVKLLASGRSRSYRDRDGRPYARPERSDRRRDDLRSSSDHDEPGQRWGHDGFEAGSGAAAAPVIAPPAKDMTQKVKISNLYHNLSLVVADPRSRRDDDADGGALRAGRRDNRMPDGLLVSAKLSYDSSGRSNGWGELVFINREIAQTAIKQFNGVELDGEPMRIELIEPVTGRLGPRTGGAPQAAQPRAERSERQKPQRSLDDRLGKRLEERLGKRLDERLGDKVEPRGRAARSDGDWGAAREATLSSGGRESRGPRGRGGRRPGASSRDTTGMDLDGELDQYMSQASNRNAAPAVREIISYADADAPHGAVASF